MTQRVRSIGGGSRAGGGAPPQTTQEALERARRHARRAAAEALAAARAILDALSLALRGEPAETQRAIGRLAKALDEMFESLSGDSNTVSAPLVGAILDALDLEIGRWETRSSDDSEARAVLRAFIGLREILWEFGLRRENSAPKSPERSASSADSGHGGRRVQRVEVKG